MPLTMTCNPPTRSCLMASSRAAWLTASTSSSSRRPRPAQVHSAWNSRDKVRNILLSCGVVCLSTGRLQVRVVLVLHQRPLPPLHRSSQLHGLRWLQRDCVSRGREPVLRRFWQCGAVPLWVVPIRRTGVPHLLYGVSAPTHSHYHNYLCNCTFHWEHSVAKPF